MAATIIVDRRLGMSLIDLDKVINGEFRNLDDVLAASVLVSDGQVQVRKADGAVYTGILEQARITYARVKETFESEGSNEPETPWYKVAADFFIAEAKQAIATGSVKGYTDQQMRLFERYTRELYNAMNAAAPLLDVDDDTGKHVLGGRSAVNNWMKEDAERREQEQRKHSAELAKRLGVDVSVLTGEAEEPEGAETGEGFDLSQFPNATSRRKVVELLELLAEIASIREMDKVGKEDGTDKVVRLVDSWIKTGQTVLQKDFANVVRAAEEESEEGGNGGRSGTHG